MWNFVFSGIEKYYNLKHAPFSGFTFDQTSLYECLAFKKIDENTKWSYLICHLLRIVLNLKMAGHDSQVKKFIFQVICLTMCPSARWFNVLISVFL